MRLMLLPHEAEHFAADAARGGLVDWLEGAEARDVVVRVNAVGTPGHEDDLRAVAALPRVAGLMLPKAEDVGAKIGRAHV